MKLLYAIPAVFVFLALLLEVNSLPEPFVKLFGAQDYYHSQYPQYRPRNRGRSYGSEGGNRRYKAICHVHAVDSLGFPGRVGNPVCPY